MAGTSHFAAPPAMRYGHASSSHARSGSGSGSGDVSDSSTHIEEDQAAQIMMKKRLRRHRHAKTNSLSLGGSRDFHRAHVESSPEEEEPAPKAADVLFDAQLFPSNTPSWTPSMTALEENFQVEKQYLLRQPDPEEDPAYGRARTVRPRSWRQPLRRLPSRKKLLLTLAAFIVSLWLIYGSASLKSLLSRMQWRVAPSPKGETPPSSGYHAPHIPPVAGSGRPKKVQEEAILPGDGMIELADGPRPEKQVFPASDAAPFKYLSSEQSRRVEPVEAYEPLTKNLEALDDWIALGKIHPSLSFPPEHAARKHDLIVSSVNGTDWEHRRAFERHWQSSKGKIREWWAGTKSSERSLSDESKISLEKREAAVDAGPNRFREIDELKYTVRSAHASLKDLGTIHLLTPSFFPPSPYDTWPQQGAPASWEAPKKKHSVFPAETGRMQWGQLPQWLDVNKTDVLVGKEAIENAEQKGGLRVHHDWSIYTPNWLANASTPYASADAMTEWKENVLPTFNSIAFESMLGHEGMTGLSDNFVYANDDVFFGANVPGTAFSSPLFGQVLAYDPTIPVRAKQLPGEDATGEWPSFEHSAWLLDERFGPRVRDYPLHAPMSMNKALLREMRMMWAKEWRITSADRFRREQISRPGTSTHFLYGHFIIERYREAMLWSFFMLRVDENMDGFVDIDEFKKHMLHPMGLLSSFPTSFADIPTLSLRFTANIQFPYRASLDNDKHLSDLQKLDFKNPKPVKYDFVSHDGYPFFSLHPFYQAKAPPRPPGAGRLPSLGDNFKEPWPRYHPREGKTRQTDGRYKLKQGACSINLASCLANVAAFDRFKTQLSAEDLFRTFAYERADTCGDCLLVHLVGWSGDSGLSAVLPSSSQRFPAAPANQASSSLPPLEPHLPLTTSYKAPNPLAASPNGSGGDGSNPFSHSHFSADSISSKLHWSSLPTRHFALSLLQRYAFTLASYPTRFHRMTSPSHLRTFLNSLPDPTAKKGDGSTEGEEAQLAEDDDDDSSWVFLGLNDDYPRDVEGAMARLFKAWAQKQWKSKSPWEE